MKHDRSEKALIHMQHLFNVANIEAYKSDFIHDRIIIADKEPMVFVWVIRDCGTHIYIIDKLASECDSREAYHIHLRLTLKSLKYHRDNDNVIETYAFYDGDSAAIHIDDAIHLVKSYLPARSYCDSDTE